MAPGYRIAQPYCLALGPPSPAAPDGVWYLGCRTVDGCDKICTAAPLHPSPKPWLTRPPVHTHPAFDAMYPELARWAKATPGGPRRCAVALGPDGASFFGCAPGAGAVWTGIAPDLRAAVEARPDPPARVALGAHGAWVALWASGDAAWRFGGCYAELDRLLAHERAARGGVASLAISPFHADHYFVVFRDASVRYSLSPVWMPQMRAVFAEWQADALHELPPQPTSPRELYHQQHHQWPPHKARPPPPLHPHASPHPWPAPYPSPPSQPIFEAPDTSVPAPPPPPPQPASPLFAAMTPYGPAPQPLEAPPASKKARLVTRSPVALANKGTAQQPALQAPQGRHAQQQQQQQHRQRRRRGGRGLARVADVGPPVDAAALGRKQRRPPEVHGLGDGGRRDVQDYVGTLRI